MNLAQIQKEIINALFKEDDTAIRHIVGNTQFNAKQRLDVYKGSVYGTLIDSLEKTFPICKSLVGEDFFNQMCTVFIQQYPPKTPYFIHYGIDFIKFIANFKPTQSLFYLTEMADFEWTRHQVWHAKLTPSVDFSALAKLSAIEQQSLQFILAPSVQLKNYQYAVEQIWFAHQAHSEIQFQEIDLNQGFQAIFWRNSEKVQIKTFDLDRTSVKLFLDAIDKKSRLPELTAQFMEKLPEYLSLSIEKGWIEGWNFLH